MTTQHYHPPGRLAPALPGYYIPDTVPGAIVVVYPRALLAGYVAKPPQDASLEMVVAIHASLKAVEAVDAVLERIFTPK